MATFDEKRDESLEELRARLPTEHEIVTSTLSRFFQRHGLTRKETLVTP